MTRGKYARYAVVYRSKGYSTGNRSQYTISKHVTRSAAVRKAKSMRNRSASFSDGPFNYQVHKIAGR